MSDERLIHILICITVGASLVALVASAGTAYYAHRIMSMLP